MKLIKTEKWGVSKSAKRELVPNFQNSSELEYIANIKAAYEIRRILTGTQYTMADIWNVFNEEKQQQESPS